MYERILVPLDGSTLSEAAIPLAITLSSRMGCALHLTTVMSPLAPGGGFDWDVAMRDWGETYLDAMQERLQAEVDVPVSTAVLIGDAAEELLREANSSGADAIVMATHGRGVVSRAWLGSVADAVTRRSVLPVMLVRPSPSVQPDLDAVGSILVPLDGSELSEEALAYAVEVGEHLNAAYHLTRVVPHPMAVVSPYPPHTMQNSSAALEEGRIAAARYLEAHADRLRRRSLRVTTSVGVGNPAAHAILAEATAVGSGLIAMATHGYRGLRRAVLGSTADKVIRGADVPVLLCRQPEKVDQRRAAS